MADTHYRPLAQLRQHDEALWKLAYGAGNGSAVSHALAAYMLGDSELALRLLKEPELVYISAEWPVLPKAPVIEMLHSRDPDNGCGYDFWVNGDRVSYPDLPIVIEDIDPGAGHQLSEWREGSFDILANPDYSTAFKMAVVAERNAAEERSGYIEDNLQDGVTAIEVSPCASEGTDISVVPEDQAEFWTTYLRTPSGATAVNDISSKEEAIKNAQLLAYIYKVGAFRGDNAEVVVPEPQE